MANTVTVKKGDTLSAIAAKAGISLSALIKLNPQITNPNLIKPGQVVITAKPTPTTPAASTPAPAGPNDAQNAARLIAEEKKAYALSPAGIAAANAAYAAANPPVVTPTPTPTPTPIVTPTPTPTPTAEVDNFQASIDAAAGMDTSSYAVDADGDRTELTNVEFDKLTPEQQAAISGLDTNEGLGNSGFSAAQIPGNYTFDSKTGVLLLDGKPYTGSWNGSDYKAGVKGGTTSGAVAKSMADFNDPAGGGRVTLEGPSDAELARMDAFAQLQDLFDSYGLGSLAGKISEYMKQGKGPNETVLLLKQSEEYNKRFYGNTLRKTAGLNVISEAAYLELEDSYANTLRAYGLGNMLSTDRTKNEAMFAKYMGNDLAGPEFKSRIKLASDRVMNADAMTKELFKKFYPNLTDADLVAYFLSPADTLSKLEEKVTSAEIGSAAVAQGLETSMASATELAKFGIDRAAAVQGYSEIKEALPTTQKLGDIYGETGIKYDQATGEAEFLKGNQDAAVKRKRLKSLERASFQGETGISQGSGLVRSVQGKF